jgi:hypothetical protein
MILGDAVVKSMGNDFDFIGKGSACSLIRENVNNGKKNI